MGAGNKALLISKLISFKAVGAGGHMRLYWRTRPPAAEECIKLRSFSTCHTVHWYQRNANNSSAVMISPMWVVCIGLQGCGCIVCGLLWIMYVWLLIKNFRFPIDFAGHCNDSADATPQPVIY